MKTKTVARSDADKAEVRDLILATARRMVLDQGFAELSIRKLAAAVGYVPGTIYLYFKNRDEIVREICRGGFAELYERMKPAVNVADPRERLASLMRAYADFAIKNPETYRLSFMEDPKFTEEMFRRAPLETEEGPGRRAFAMIADALRELKREGRAATKRDINLQAEILWSGIHGVVSLKLIYPAFPTNSTKVLIDEMIWTLLKGII